MEAISHFFDRVGRRHNLNDDLPLYESLANGTSRDSGDLQSESSLATCTQVPEQPASSHPPASRLPSLRAFLSNFTLGFADGLTVPFALTAGLSSLGQTKTVIYAGMAEICAGSISMGIGGYLAARGENQQSRRAEAAATDAPGQSEEGLLQGRGDVEQEKSSVDAAEDGKSDVAAVMVKYLLPLRLSADLEDAVLSHVRQKGYDGCAMTDITLEKAQHGNPGSSAVVTGLSVSLGYLLGGILPLFPYFFVRQVEAGLAWSFLVCAVALFTFGFAKDFVLNNQHAVGAAGHRSTWLRIRPSLWEGIQMVVLGGIAALAAVLCVRMFDGRL
ncbi:VIT family-domain-containing protein [Lasiosphaeria hispida]|uniref:VIT family-domain-containing protein n=1 Tax=Lasiosphaeria hispida TaxID=260671 RepID=A0AAJ0HFR2_9PEZI|nr:VIT family-domain-containing protein [Lasiosphaeria hispida]